MTIYEKIELTVRVPSATVKRSRSVFFTMLATGALIIGATPLRADVVTNIDLSPYVPVSWTGEVNGTAIQAGAESGTGNAGTGLTFSDPNGGYLNLTGGVSFNLTTLSICLTAHSIVNALTNTLFSVSEGNGRDEVDYLFTNSSGATAAFSLISDQTIRTFDNGPDPNALSGTNANPALYGSVAAHNWWSTQDAGSTRNGEPSYRLDAQTFLLPASWNGTTLTGIQVINPGNIFDAAVALSALQVDTATPTSPSGVPEPSSLLLMGVGMGALAIKLRRAQ